MKLLLVLSMMVALSSNAIAAQTKVSGAGVGCGGDHPDYSHVIAYTANQPTATGKTKAAK